MAADNTDVKSVVISQPMFFPWVGLFEQIRLTDLYIHYGDVQYSKGSFVNRVQIKSPTGVTWLTVPLEGRKLGQSIEEVRINSHINWRDKHVEALQIAYSKAPHFDQMMELVHAVFGRNWRYIGELSRATIDVICEYFDLADGRQFLDIRNFDIGGSSSQRVLDIVKTFEGKRYITGWGARGYLDHQLFEDSAVRVEYMDYKRLPYPQMHGAFTPYVSILDLIANVGPRGRDYIRSGTIYWRDCIGLFQ